MHLQISYTEHLALTMGHHIQTKLLLLMLCFLLIHEVEIDSKRIMVTKAQQIDCPSKCDYRCSKASRHKMCIRACNTCCQRCNCVPSGTAGNLDECPCYRDMTTDGGRRKCP